MGLSDPAYKALNTMVRAYGMDRTDFLERVLLWMSRRDEGVQRAMIGQHQKEYETQILQMVMEDLEREGTLPPSGEEPDEIRRVPGNNPRLSPT